MPRSRPNVVIVGGGPAGSAAAIKCVKAGLTVTLVEKEQQPFSQIRPGETLHPGVQPILGELDVEQDVLSAGFLRHKGNWVEWNHDRRFSKFGEDADGPWLGFQAWRKDFDEILLNKAREKGVQVIRPCRAIRPLVAGGRIIGIETSKSSLYSSFLIDAAGSEHWLARKANLKIEKHSPPLIAWHGYAGGSCPIRDSAPAIVADKDGWTWTARVLPQIYQWTRLFFEKRHLEQGYLPTEFHGLAPISRTRGVDVTWRIVPLSAGKGYFIAGDASFVLDPASSHGVLKGLMSGIMVGHLVDQIVRHGKDENYAANAYCRWMYDWFRHDMSKLKDFYMRHPWPPKWIARTSISPAT